MPLRLLCPFPSFPPSHVFSSFFHTFPLAFPSTLGPIPPLSVLCQCLQLWPQLFRRQRMLAEPLGRGVACLAAGPGLVPGIFSSPPGCWAWRVPFRVTIQPVFRFSKNSSILPRVTRCTYLHILVLLNLNKWFVLVNPEAPKKPQQLPRASGDSFTMMKARRNGCARSSVYHPPVFVVGWGLPSGSVLSVIPFVRASKFTFVLKEFCFEIVFHHDFKISLLFIIAGSSTVLIGTIPSSVTFFIPLS